MSTREQIDIVLFSFGFKYGTPVDVNHVIDVRFLPNPYWVEELKEKTGKDEDVANYVLHSEAGKTTLSQLLPFLDFLLEQNIKAGKKIFRIGIGCTGGRHRSVAMTEKIAAHLSEMPVSLKMFHRDIDKDGLLRD